MTRTGDEPAAAAVPERDTAEANNASPTALVAAETKADPPSLPLASPGCRSAVAGPGECPGHARFASEENDDRQGLATGDQGTYAPSSRGRHAAADEVHVVPPPTPPCITPGAARALLRVLMAARDRHNERSSEEAGP